MADQSLMVAGVGVSSVRRGIELKSILKAVADIVGGIADRIRDRWIRSGGMLNRQVAMGYRDEFLMGSKGFLQ